MRATQQSTKYPPQENTEIANLSLDRRIMHFYRKPGDIARIARDERERMLGCGGRKQRVNHLPRAVAQPISRPVAPEARHGRIDAQNAIGKAGFEALQPRRERSHRGRSVRCSWRQCLCAVRRG